MTIVDGYYEFGTLHEILCERCKKPLDWLMLDDDGDGEVGDASCCDRVYRAYVNDSNINAWRVFSDKDGE